MYKTRSASGGSMGSLRRDYVARIPIDLNCSPLSSKAIHAASAAAAASHNNRYGAATARLLIGGGGARGQDGGGGGGGVSLVRCRVDSENSPTVIGEFSDDDDYDDYHVTPPRHQQKPQEMTSSSSGAGDVSVRSWSTSSEGRETGSILKKPEYGGGGGGGGGSQTLSDRSSSGKQRTPQGRRRVRFTNNVSLYRFDSDGVDSAYSSSECERLYAPISAVVAAAAAAARRPGTPNRYPSTTMTPGSSTLSSNSRTYSVGDDTYENVPRSVVVGRRIQDDNKAFALSSPPPPPPQGIIRQEVRGAPQQVLHGTPNGSLYFRNNHEKTKTVLPSAHWLGGRTPATAVGPSSSSSSSSQKQGPVIGVGSSGALRATSYTVVSDTLTQERKLVVAAKLADSFHPNDITIKANKNGNKIRIVSIKSPPHSSSSSSSLQGPSSQPQRYQALNEQIVLPVQVDPWKLTARLDPNGSLYIEAPCAD